MYVCVLTMCTENTRHLQSHPGVHLLNCLHCLWARNLLYHGSSDCGHHVPAMRGWKVQLHHQVEQLGQLQAVPCWNVQQRSCEWHVPFVCSGVVFVSRWGHVMHCGHCRLQDCGQHAEVEPRVPPIRCHVHQRQDRYHHHHAGLHFADAVPCWHVQRSWVYLMHELSRWKVLERARCIRVPGVRCRHLCRYGGINNVQAVLSWLLRLLDWTQHLHKVPGRDLLERTCCHQHQPVLPVPCWLLFSHCRVLAMHQLYGWILLSHHSIFHGQLHDLRGRDVRNPPCRFPVVRQLSHRDLLFQRRADVCWHVPGLRHWQILGHCCIHVLHILLRRDFVLCTGCQLVQHMQGMPCWLLRNQPGVQCLHRLRHRELRKAFARCNNFHWKLLCMSHGHMVFRSEDHVVYSMRPWQVEQSDWAGVPGWLPMATDGLHLIVYSHAFTKKVYQVRDMITHLIMFTDHHKTKHRTSACRAWLERTRSSPSSPAQGSAPSARQGTIPLSRARRTAAPASRATRGRTPSRPGSRMESSAPSVGQVSMRVHPD